MVAFGAAGQGVLERALEVAALASGHVQRVAFGRALGARGLPSAAAAPVLGSEEDDGTPGARCSVAVPASSLESRCMSATTASRRSLRSEITDSMSARRRLASSMIRWASAVALAIVCSASLSARRRMSTAAASTSSRTFLA